MPTGYGPRAPLLRRKSMTLKTVAHGYLPYGNLLDFNSLFNPDFQDPIPAAKPQGQDPVPSPASSPRTLRLKAHADKNRVNMSSDFQDPKSRQKAVVDFFKVYDDFQIGAQERVKRLERVKKGASFVAGLGISLFPGVPPLVKSISAELIKNGVNYTVENTVDVVNRQLDLQGAIAAKAAIQKLLRDGNFIVQIPPELTKEEVEALLVQTSLTFYGKDLATIKDPTVRSEMAIAIGQGVFQTLALSDAASRIRDHDIGMAIAELNKGLANLKKQVDSAKLGAGEKAVDLDEPVQALKNAEGLAKAKIALKEEINRRLQGLEESGKRTANALQGMSDRMDQNLALLNSVKDDTGKTLEIVTQLQNDSNFIKFFLYGNASGSQQVEALKTGIFDKKTAELLLPQAELKAASEDLNQKIRALATIGGFAANILESLDVSPSVVKAIDAGIGVADAVGGVFSGFASGGLFGAALGLFDGLNSLLFGGGGAKRHEQVMKAFDQVVQNQQEIYKAVAQVAATQNQIIDNQKILGEMIEAVLNNQKAILEGLVALGKGLEVVVQNQNLIAAKLDRLTEMLDVRLFTIERMLYEVEGRITDELRTNRNITLASLEQPFNLLRNVSQSLYRRDRNGQLEYPSVEEGVLRNYDEVQRHFGFFGTDLMEGLRGLSAAFANKDRIHPLFLARSYEVDSQDNVRLLGQIQTRRSYQASLRLFDAIYDVYKPTVDFGTYGRLFAEPAPNFTTLNNRVDLLETWRRGEEVSTDFFASGTEAGVPGFRDVTRAQIDDYLNPRVVIEAGHWALQFYHYYELINYRNSGGLELLPAEQLASNRPVNFRGQDLLKSTLHLVNLALLQQAILSGSLNATFLYGSPGPLPDSHLYPGRDANIETFNDQFSWQTLARFFAPSDVEKFLPADSVESKVYSPVSDKGGMSKRLETKRNWWELGEACAENQLLAKNLANAEVSLSVAENPLLKVPGIFFTQEIWGAFVRGRIYRGGAKENGYTFSDRDNYDESIQSFVTKGCAFQDNILWGPLLLIRREGQENNWSSTRDSVFVKPEEYLALLNAGKIDTSPRYLRDYENLLGKSPVSWSDPEVSFLDSQWDRWKFVGIPDFVNTKGLTAFGSIRNGQPDFTAKSSQGSARTGQRSNLPEAAVRYCRQIRRPLPTIAEFDRPQYTASYWLLFNLRQALINELAECYVVEKMQTDPEMKTLVLEAVR